MNNFKETIDIELRRKNDPTNSQIDSLNSETQSDDRNVVAAPTEKQTIERKSLMDQMLASKAQPERSSTTPRSLMEQVLASKSQPERSTTMSRSSSIGFEGRGGALVLLAILLLAVGVLSQFLSASRENSFAKSSVIELKDLKTVAGKNTLVHIQGDASNSNSVDKVVFQKLRLREPGRYGRVYDSVSPRYFAVSDGQHSILIDGSALADFASKPEKHPQSSIVKALRDKPENAKTMENRLVQIQTWSINSGDQVTASGQVVWDKQQQHYVLQAPSITIAPLAAGMIQLKTTNGLETY